jgi:hypothetical protein
MFGMLDPITGVRAQLFMLGLAEAPASCNIVIMWAATVVGMPLVALGMYLIARRRGLTHANAVEVLHGKRYLDGSPVNFPPMVAKAFSIK